MEFVEHQHRVGFLGRVDPSFLLTAARQKLAVDNWPEALLILEEAQDMFKRSRRPRDRDLWFEIR